MVADLTAGVSVLGKFLHPLTAANLADAVRIMNTYYSNLIEGHNTRPRDIERAFSGELDQNEERRNLQIEAAAHVRVQTTINQMSLEGTLPPATSQVHYSAESSQPIRGRGADSLPGTPRKELDRAAC